MCIRDSFCSKFIRRNVTTSHIDIIQCHNNRSAICSRLHVPVCFPNNSKDPPKFIRLIASNCERNAYRSQHSGTVLSTCLFDLDTIFIADITQKQRNLATFFTAGTRRNKFVVLRDVYKRQTLLRLCQCGMLSISYLPSLPS